MSDLLCLCSAQAGHCAAAAQAPASPTRTAVGNEGDHRGWVHVDLPSHHLTTRAPSMLFYQNISPVHPNLWEHHNSFLTPSQHQLSSPFLDRLVVELGTPHSQVSKAWQPGASVSTSYIPWRMQSEVSPCTSRIPGGIPGIASSTMKHFLWGGTFRFFFLNKML